MQSFNKKLSHTIGTMIYFDKSLKKNKSDVQGSNVNLVSMPDRRQKNPFCEF